MARSAPRPPFSTDLLADLHADNVAPDLSEQLWPQVRRDPEALRFLRSLDDVTAELRTLGQDSAILHPMPAEVTARLDRLLDQLACADPPQGGKSAELVQAAGCGTEHVATVHHLPFAQPPGDQPTTQPIHTLPMPVVEVAAETPADGISVVRLDRRRWRWLAAAAAAIAVVAGSLVAVDAFRDHPAAPDATPTPQSDDVQLSNDLPVSQLLGAMGRRDLSGPLADPGALAGCLAGAGLDRTVLGAMNATYHSKPAVLVLLTGPNPPKITAVVLGKDCRPSDPHVLVTQDIG